jgi:hypothetical protein
MTKHCAVIPRMRYCHVHASLNTHNTRAVHVLHCTVPRFAVQVDVLQTVIVIHYGFPRDFKEDAREKSFLGAQILRICNAARNNTDVAI